MRQAGRQALVQDLRAAASTRQQQILMARTQSRPSWRKAAPSTQTLLQSGLGAIVLGLAVYATRRYLPRSSDDLEVLLPLPSAVSISPTRPPLPVFDAQALSASAGNDESMLKEVVEVFVRETDDRLRQIRLAIDVSAGTEAKRIAQDAAGSSALCGASGMSTLFRKLVDLCGQNRIPEAALVCGELEKAWPPVRQVMVQQANLPAEIALEPKFDSARQALEILSRSGGSMVRANPALDSESRPDTDTDTDAKAKAKAKCESSPDAVATSAAPPGPAST